MIDLTTHGAPFNLARPVVGRVARATVSSAESRKSVILVAESLPSVEDVRGYRGVVTTLSLTSAERQAVLAVPTIHATKQIAHLKTGDIVVMQPRSGLVRTLFRPDSSQNALLLTERCNSFCLMCSQPPIDRDDSDLVEINLEAIRLMDPPPRSLGLTGGEPTLLGENLFRVFSELSARLPNTAIHMLTNGRRFARPDFTEAFIDVAPPRLTLGIPLYADNAPLHDYVVQAKHAFDQTMQGLHELARYAQPVEIRVVLHALTIPRLQSLVEFIYRNIPFAAHVALMGLEITGFTRANLRELWIDPFDYQDALTDAVEFLAVRGMSVSLYNHQLCVVPKRLWRFARQSISDWKNLYLDICASCAVREQCGGLFTSAGRQHSAHLCPVPAV
jgi:His-Xaa-Ser system radical SAM maturase HxsC